MAVWVVIPSADPVKASAASNAWDAMGYEVCLGMPKMMLLAASSLMYYELFHDVPDPWPGYPSVVNEMLKLIMRADENCQVAVAAADDMFPDPTKTADVIEREFMKRFEAWDEHIAAFMSFFGTRVDLGAMEGYLVMQPCGDTWMEHAASRICGSPWISRAWAMRGYGGRGAFWPEYSHFYADEELWNVANDHGFLWLRPDLEQRHDHWTRLNQDRPAYMEAKCAGWDRDKAMFQQRREAKFLGWDPV